MKYRGAGATLSGMTPRLALAAIFLLPALASAQQACPYYYFEEKPGPAPAPVITAEACAFMKSLEQPFAKLVAAAGLDKATLSKAVFVQPSWNAFAAPGGWIVFNDKFIEKWSGDRAVAIAVLAHELGHVVQERDGEAAKRDEVWRANGEGKAWNDFNRKFESQADRIAGELLSLAGYPPELQARAEGAISSSDFRLSSDHTHPATGIRWLEALKQQESLAAKRHEESLGVMRRRTRALMSRPAFDRDPHARTDDDARSPLEWARTDPAAAAYRDRKKFAAAAALNEFDSQGRRPPMARSWRVSLTEPPLSAAPPDAREVEGVSALSLSDRLALRARTAGPQESYAAAVWSGAWDWAKEGLGLKKAPAPVKP